MAKKCDKKNYVEPKEARFFCKKCNRKAKKKDKLCKAKKIKKAKEIIRPDELRII